MSEFAVPAPPVPSVAIAGSAQRFPVHRIYCVGRNYIEHAKEMGSDPERDPPVFFTKPADAVMPSEAVIPYPPKTANLHHEIELVIAIARPGRDIAKEQALEHVFGYAVGNDLTRRDLQHEAKRNAAPWDASKGFDASAPIGAIRPASAGHILEGRIWLSVNGQLRQDANVNAMIWSVPAVIAQLSRFFTLKPGDLIYSGTPAGVGPLRPGDRVEGGIDGLPGLRNTIGTAEG
jgi:fumarylpyruvate hydrolase